MEADRLSQHKGVAMTTSIIASRPVCLVPISSNERDLWNHPMLDLYRQNVRENIVQKPLLYVMPSSFGEDYDPEFAPHPTSASELPDLQTWTLKFATSVLEIWSAKRQPAPLARGCHHTIYSQLVAQVGSLSDVGRIRKLHQCQPLDGICESTVTVRFNDRIRSLVLRFEGIDHRWLCTSLTLL
jgi:hypothetical protein